MVSVTREGEGIPTVAASAAARRAHSGRFGFSHVPALDGLRGLAVAAVLLYHAEHLKGGYLGVDLFFVLSGYLITSLLLAEHAGTGTIALGKFWGRRIRRLMPALLVLMLGVAVYARVVARPVDLDGIRGDAFATLAYVANWRTIFHGTSYWDISSAPSPLQHVWSLAIEEQFYLVWPLVVALVVRGRKHAAGLVGTIAVVGAFLSAALFVGLHHLGASDNRVYEGTDTRAAALLMGVALAAWRRRALDRRAEAEASGQATPAELEAADRSARRVSPWLEASGLLAAVGLGVLWFRLDGQSPWLYRGGLPFASLLAVTVVAAASHPGSPILGRVFSLRPLRQLGAISYGLYLWHWPIFQAIDTKVLEPIGLLGLHTVGWKVLILKLACSVTAAQLSYFLIEMPIRRGRLTGPVAIPATIGGIALAGLVTFAATAGGVTAPNIDQNVVAAETIKGAPTVLFVGDSVSLSSVKLVASDPRRYGINPLSVAYPGCTVVGAGRNMADFVGRAYAPAPCESKIMPALAHLHPDLIVSLIGARPNDAVEVDGSFVRACAPSFDETYIRSNEALLRKIRAVTKAPIVVGTVLYSSATSIRVHGDNDRVTCVNKDIRAYAKAVPGTHVIDANELLCPDISPCVEELGGEPVRSDGLHFDQGPGGARAVDWIVTHALDAARIKPATGTKPGVPSAGG